MNDANDSLTKKAIKRTLILILGTISLTAFILLFENGKFPVKSFLIVIAIFIPIIIISAVIGYKYRQQILKSSIKMNVKNYGAYYWPRILYWPFTKEQTLKWNKPVNILLRIKIIFIVLFGVAAYGYFSLGRLDSYVLGFFVGGVFGVIFGIFFYYAVKSGKITFDKTK